jgi:hypothetical protein
VDVRRTLPANKERTLPTNKETSLAAAALTVAGLELNMAAKEYLVERL